MSDKPAYMQAAAAVAVKIAEVRRARRAAFRNVETKEGRQEFLILQREVDEQYGVLLRMIVDDSCSMAQVEELLETIRREDHDR